MLFKMSRRIWLPLAVISMAALATLFVAPPPASTDNGATVVNGFDCSVLAADGITPCCSTTDSHTVIAPNGDCMQVCHANVPNPTGHALTFSGFECGTLCGTATDSHETISASGETTLVCLFHHK